MLLRYRLAVGLIAAVTPALASAQVAEIRLKTPPKPLGSGDVGQISIALVDSKGKPTKGVVTVTVDAGTVTTPIMLVQGLYSAVFTAPDHFPAGNSVHVTAKSPGTEASSAISADATIELRASKPAKVVFTKVPPAAATPGQSAPIELQVVDKNDNVVAAPNLQVAADKGQITDLHQRADGVWEGQYKAPNSSADDVSLSAKDPDSSLEEVQHLSVVSLERPTLVLVGPVGGFTSNFGQVDSLAVEAVALVHVSYFGFGLFGGYLPASTETLSSTTAGSTATGSLNLSRLPIHARAGALLFPGDFQVYAGLEAGPTLVNGTLKAENETLNVSSWRFEYGAYLGGGYHLGPGFITAEVRGTQATVNQSSPDGVLNVQGSVGGIDLSVGYLFSI